MTTDAHWANKSTAQPSLCEARNSTKSLPSRNRAACILNATLQVALPKWGPNHTTTFCHPFATCPSWQQRLSIGYSCRTSCRRRRLWRWPQRHGTIYPANHCYHITEGHTDSSLETFRDAVVDASLFVFATTRATRRNDEIQWPQNLPVLNLFLGWVRWNSRITINVQV